MKRNTNGSFNSIFETDIRFIPNGRKQPLESTESPENLPELFRKQLISGSRMVFYRYPFGIIFSQKIIVRKNIFWLHTFHIETDAVLLLAANLPLIFLNYMLTGNIEYNINGTRANFKERRYQLCSLSSGVSYTAKFLAGEYIAFHATVPEDIIKDMADIYPKDEQLKQLIASISPDTFYTPLFNISAAIDHHIKIILNEKIVRSDRQRFARNIIWEEQLTGLFSHYLEDKNNSIAQEEWNKKQQIKAGDLKQYILDNVVENGIAGPNQLTLDNILNKLHMKKHDFRKSVQEKYKCNWKTLVHETQLEKAAELLIRYPEKTVADIASWLEYSVPTHFSRAFKKKFGVSPGAYKKMNSSGK
jgi:AraC-like DNA-binding protein